ncbi:hypothetical protein T4B_11380 [Trichinella pseudospiralis]|uniref:Uncharacterized protein n=1 Tax=Trichinella pseudospiralis TaxID=6337 RepID=A0A0V1IW64_TRIPS|nr:hypothetical protein T4A_5294 [Trichinella pseudospiralis]KRZ27008.1 hypothetical protein T4B_11380 [Trichinella pseudospiralis]KRZ41479.1 hypothetical protein T4C_4542 [Trichinella pseudospiralis]
MHIPLRRPFMLSSMLLPLTIHACISMSGMLILQIAHARLERVALTWPTHEMTKQACQLSPPTLILLIRICGTFRIDSTFNR